MIYALLVSLISLLVFGDSSLHAAARRIRSTDIIIAHCNTDFVDRMSQETKETTNILVLNNPVATRVSGNLKSSYCETFCARKSALDLLPTDLRSFPNLKAIILQGYEWKEFDIFLAAFDNKVLFYAFKELSYADIRKLWHSGALDPDAKCSFITSEDFDTRGFTIENSRDFVSRDLCLTPLCSAFCIAALSYLL